MDTDGAAPIRPTRLCLRRATREFNLFMGPWGHIGAEPDPVSPDERPIKRLIYDRKKRTFREEDISP